jgi:replicative DNA helicase
VTELRPLSGGGGRVPPHDLDAEAAVLSTVILSPVEYDVVAAIVQAEQFYSEANRNIFRAVAVLSEASSPIDVVTVATWLRAQGRLEQVGGAPYLIQILDGTPAVANVAAHAHIVRDKWQKRQLIATCQRFAAEGFASPELAQPIVLMAEAALSELASFGVGEQLEPVGVIADRELKAMQAAHTAGKKTAGLPSGFPRLDSLTGGLHATDLLVVAGRPGMGKSAWAVNLSANIARPKGEQQGTGVAFFSLEMPKGQLALRFACAEGNVSAAAVRNGLLKPLAQQDLERSVQELVRFPIWIDDTPAISLFELRARVRKLQRDIQAKRAPVQCDQLSLVVVDYLQLMTGQRGRGDSREGEVASLSRGLKQLAKDMKVTVLAVSQLNRAVEKSSKSDKRPQLSDLRESGAIEQDADAVYFVFREEYYDDTAKKGTAELIIGKQRNGPCETVMMHFKGASMRFYEADGGEYDYGVDAEDMS